MDFRTNSNPRKRPRPTHDRPPANPPAGHATHAGGAAPPRLQGARGQPRPSQRQRNFPQGQDRNTGRTAQGAGSSGQPDGATSSTLRQARPFNPQASRVVIGSWSDLRTRLDQGPPFPAKLFDGMMIFLSREGRDWVNAHKRWEQQGCRERQAPRRPDAGCFTELAAPESEGSSRLLIDTLLDDFWRQLPGEVSHFGPMKLSQWAYAMPLWSETRTAPVLLRKTRELVSHKAMKLDGRSIGSLAYNLRHVPRQHQERVSDVLDGLSAKMVAASPGGIRLDGQGIGNALYGLQNLKDSEEVRGFLKALTVHMAAVPLGSIRLNGLDIGNALYGLQNLPDSEEVRGFLKALEQHLARDTWTAEGIIEPHLFLADVLHSLRGHLQVPATPRILASLYHRLGQPQERLAAAQKDTAAECYRLFKAGGGLRSFSERQRGLAHDLPGIAPGGAYWELDLHGCSHKQAPFLLRSALDRDNSDLSGIVRVIYGIGKHNEHNRGAMRELVSQTLSDPANAGLQGLMLGTQFHEGYVWVYKPSPIADAASDGWHEKESRRRSRPAQR